MSGTKKYYVIKLSAEDDYKCIHQLTKSEYQGIYKICNESSIISTGGGYCGSISISEGFDTLEEAEEVMYQY